MGGAGVARYGVIGAQWRDPKPGLVLHLAASGLLYVQASLG